MKTCGLDVHNVSIFCAIYNGKSYSEVKEYDMMTKVWDILLEMGFTLHLVNPFLIKQMSGRKSDVKDAQWIACLLNKGLIRGSVVPCKRWTG